MKVLNRINRVNIEKCLCLWAVIIALVHALLATFRYVIPYQHFTPYEQWISIGFFSAVILYFIISVVASKESRIYVFQQLKKLFTFEQVLLIGLLLWFIISCWVNGLKLYYPTIYLGIHDWLLYDMAVCVLILYPIAHFLRYEQAKKVFEFIIHVVVVLYTVFTVVCLWHIFHLEVLDLPSGEQAGVTAEVQLMLGQHYNLTGMIATAMFCLSVYIIFTQKDLFIRSLYIFFAFIHLIVIYLCNSRTIFVGVLCFVVFSAFFLSWQFFSGKKKSVCFLISLILCCSVGILFWVGRPVAFKAFERITHFSEALAAETGGIGSQIYSYRPSLLASSEWDRAALYLTDCSAVNRINLAINSSDVRAISTGLSNRESIWVAALKTLSASKFSAVFGVTPFEVPDALMEIGGHWAVAAHAHNSILQTGVSMGTPAMALFVAFLVSVVLRCFRVCFSQKNPDSVSTVIISSSIFCFLVISMAEAYLTVHFNALACFFFLFTGFLPAIRNEGASEQTKRKEKKITGISNFISLFIGVCFSVAIVIYAGNYLNVNADRISGSGTEWDPYLIEDASDLSYFRNLVNHGKRFGGCYFLQTNDIDLKNREWKPIGVYGTRKSFEGTYDGANHVIENLKISSNRTNNRNRAALFDSLSGIVENLSVRSGVIYGKEIVTDTAGERNLLLGTNRGVLNFNIGDNGFNAKLAEEDDGVKVSFSERDDNGWLVLSFDDGRSRYLLSGPEGDTYTLSFRIKSNVKDAVVSVSHKNANSKDVQIDFGSITTKKAEEWEEIVLEGKLIGTEPSSQVLYFDLRNNPAGTEISFCDLKLEKGTNHTAWVPASEDAIAVSGRVYS